MKRYSIALSVRSDDDEPVERVAERVGQALGCAFTETETRRNNYAHVAHALGLELRLSGALGVGRKPVSRLVGFVKEKSLRRIPEEAGHVALDISAYVADLLTIRTGLQWYQPTKEDIAAENEASAARDDWSGGVGERWSWDD